MVRTLQQFAGTLSISPICPQTRQTRGRPQLQRASALEAGTLKSLGKRLFRSVAPALQQEFSTDPPQLGFVIAIEIRARQMQPLVDEGQTLVDPAGDKQRVCENCQMIGNGHHAAALAEALDAS